MIGVSMYHAIFIYMTIWLAFIIVLWFRMLLRRQRSYWSITDSRLFNCGNCHFAFLSKEEVNLTRCPRCNAICIRRRSRSR